MDIEKRFDTSDHAFMTSVLKNLAFEHAFMTNEFDFRKILLSGLNFYQIIRNHVLTMVKTPHNIFVKNE